MVRMGVYNQFPSFPPNAYPALPAGFRDSSWANDGQPSMASRELQLFIVIDWPNPADRHDPNGLRFAIYETDEEGAPDDVPFISTDDWNAALAFLEVRLEGFKREGKL
jgi:hypothetical protein